MHTLNFCVCVCVTGFYSINFSLFSLWIGLLFLPLPLCDAVALAKVVDDEKEKYMFYIVFFFTMKESHENIRNSF